MRAPRAVLDRLENLESQVIPDLMELLGRLKIEVGSIKSSLKMIVYLSAASGVFNGLGGIGAILPHATDVNAEMPSIPHQVCPDSQPIQPHPRINHADVP